MDAPGYASSLVVRQRELLEHDFHPLLASGGLGDPTRAVVGHPSVAELGVELDDR
jgi:hypothetical protein